MTPKCPECQAKLVRIGKGENKFQCLVCDKSFLVSPDGKRVKEFSEAACDWREYVDILDDKIALSKKASIGGKVEASASLASSDILLNLSDLHLGSGGVNYRFFRELTDTLIEYQIPFALTGDENDNFFPNFRTAKPVLGQVMSPAEQLKFFESWLSEVKDLMICSAGGNHNEMWEILTGYDAVNEIKARFAPYIDGMGVLNLTVGKVKYKVGMTHKGQGGSKWNKNHRLANIAREKISGLDVIFGGHLHQEEITGAYIREGWVWQVSGGSIKADDDYARRNFTFGGRLPEFSCVWFDDKEKRVVAFRSLQEAIFWRNMVRENEKEYRKIVSVG